MPQRSLEGFTAADRARLSGYQPGYDWIPGRFGPPPGISRARKQQLDRMSDRDYMSAVLRLGQEERESLMISEAERLRTYRTLWPNIDFIDYRELAREGFYYTGVSDRVQCAFCAGFLSNWEAGDSPRNSHRQFFNYCKMVKRKPCANMPFSNDEDSLPEELTMSVLSTRSDSNNGGSIRASDLGISTDRPSHPRYRVSSNRLATYRNYARSSYPMIPERLSAAGFYHEGPGDKVRCFWCDGALELWNDGDDPWTEHAKWYPGCGFMQQVKGREFIRRSRTEMSAEELATAGNLQYNNSGATFLVEIEAALSSPSPSPSRYDSYKVCESLGFSTEELDSAFSLNNGADFRSEQVLISVLLAARDINKGELENIMQKEKSSRQNTDEDDATPMEPFSNYSFVNIEDYVKASADVLNQSDAEKIVGAMGCSVCWTEEIGAALLPCGHLTLCQTCSRTRLPEKCPVCNKAVRGACRTFLC